MRLCLFCLILGSTLILAACTPALVEEPVIQPVTEEIEKQSTPTDLPTRSTRQPRQPTSTLVAAQPTATTPIDPAQDIDEDNTLILIDYGAQGRFLDHAWVTDDGRYLLAILDDQMVNVFDLQSGQTWLFQTPIRLASGSDVFIIEDEMIIADYAPREGNNVTLLQANMATGESEILGQAYVGDAQVFVFRFSPDNSQFAVGYHNGTIRLFNTSNANLIRTISAHIDNVVSLNYSPDGRYLVSDSWSFDLTVRVYDSSNGTLVATLTEESWEPGLVSFSRDGRLIAATKGDGTHIFSTSTWIETGSVIQGVWDGQFTCDSTGIMVNRDGQTDLYSTLDGELVATISSYPLLCLYDGTEVWTDLSDDVLRLFRLEE